MTLRRKTLTRIGITIAALIVVLYAASHAILLRSFIALEERYVYRDVERAQSAVFAELGALETIVGDWAPWDDTYEFVANGNSEYIQSNLVDETFTGIGINTMLFVNSAGQLVFGKSVDLDAEEQVPVTHDILVHLVGDDFLVYHPDTTSKVTGIVLLAEGPMFVSSQPILTSEEEGPIHGALMMGRYLDDGMIEDLAETAHLSLTLYPLDDPGMPDDFSTAQSTLTEQEETIFIQSLGKENIAGYTLLRDVHGEPILVMRVDMPRDIYGQGQTSLSYFAWSLLIVGLIFGLLALLLLERLVLSRLARISEAISDISASGDLSARVVVTGKDELSNLANEINNMLEALQVSDIQLAERGRDLARRVRHLKATAEVAQYTTAVLDPQELLSRVVTMIGERFGFYHVAIFLLDPAGEWAVLQAASSEGGRQLLARKYRMRVGREGIVGHVTNWGDPRIVPDVEADTMFSAVPELPDTRSEMVWPLRARGKIIGALDVQSKELQAFDKDDVAVLHTLADQIAVALSNARLFQQLQESLDRQQRTFGELSSRAWIDTLQSQSGMGYRYTRGSITPLTGLPRSEQSAPEASVEMQHSEGEQALPQLAIPLRVREYEIGTINVHKSADAGDWTPEEMAMLETMTDQLGVALESARLYQDAQRRAARERLVSDVTARMRETLDVNTVLQTAVREIRQVLGLHDVTIRLGESVERPRRATRKPDEEVRS